MVYKKKPTTLCMSKEMQERAKSLAWRLHLMSLRILTKVSSFWRHTLISSTCVSSHFFHAGAWNVNPRLRNEFSGIPGLHRFSIGGSLHSHRRQYDILFWLLPLPKARFVLVPLN